MLPCVVFNWSFDNNLIGPMHENAIKITNLRRRLLKLDGQFVKMVPLFRQFFRCCNLFFQSIHSTGIPNWLGLSQKTTCGTIVWSDSSVGGRWYSLFMNERICTEGYFSHCRVESAYIFCVLFTQTPTVPSELTRIWTWRCVAIYKEHVWTFYSAPQCTLIWSSVEAV